MIYLENNTNPQELYIPRNSTINVAQTGIDLSNYLTSGQTMELIDETIDEKMGDYATEEWVESQGYLTEHQSLDGYATEQWVENKGYLTEHQSLDNYYTKQQVDQAIEDIDVSDQIQPIVDDINTINQTLETKADKSEIPSLSGYATEQWVENKGYLTEHQSLSGLISGAEYVSSSQTIVFTDKSGNTIDTIDASDFIKDGMVSNVEIVNGNLVISFNTDAGKQPISIALTDIFNPANYYDKTAIDGLFAAETARTESTYLKEHQSLSGYSTTQEMNTAINNAVSGLASEQWVENKGYLTEHQSLDDYYTKTQVDGAVNGLESHLNEVEEVVSVALNDLNDTKADKSEIPSLSGYATEQYVENAVSGIPTEFKTINNESIVGSGNIEIQGGGFYSAGTNIDITNNVISVTGITVPDVSNFVTSGQVEDQITAVTSTKQDTLVSGTNIKTINNESILGSGNITIQGGSGGTSNIIELTKAEYDALGTYEEDALYVITDANSVDLNDYALKEDVESAVTELTETVSTKATKANTTARSGYYWPYWNSDGIITGSTGPAYQSSQNINGSSYIFYRNSSSTLPASYAPTTVGTKNQILLSNGSGAPVWSTVKFEFLSQSAYDALSTKDSTTVYFIISDE